MHCHHPSLLLQLLSPPCSSLQSAPSAPTPLFVQVAAIPVYMSGSRRRLMAYCFVRDDMPSVTGRASASSSRRTAAAASVQKYDLTTLPGFQPGNVMGVLASQATGRCRRQTDTKDVRAIRTGRGLSPGRPCVHCVAGYYPNQVAPAPCRLPVFMPAAA